jgi:hypothetical protein
VKEPGVLISLFDAANLASLLPKGSLCLEGASKGSPGVISKQHLAICKRTGLLEEIQKINKEPAVVIKLGNKFMLFLYLLEKFNHNSLTCKKVLPPYQNISRFRLLA